MDQKEGKASAGRAPAGRPGSGLTHVQDVVVLVGGGDGDVALVAHERGGPRAETHRHLRVLGHVALARSRWKLP